jgi:DNA-binding GntR family transcriptional regulator
MLEIAPPIALTPLTTPLDLAQRVYDALLQAICNGEIKSGEKITQEAVAQMLGVSRQPVLQALRQLESEGLLQDSPNKKGMQLVPLDAHFVSQLYTVRATLDALASRCAGAIPRPDLREHGYMLLKTGRTAAQHGDLAGLVDTDLLFHQFIYQAANNAVLDQTARLHWHHTRRVMSTYLQMPTSFKTIWNEHQAILEAVIKGQARLAEKLSKQHALNSVEFIFSKWSHDYATER